MDRKLASIQVISEIRPIEGADKIQVCMLKDLGWECVIKKDEYKIGDLVVYIETDSRVPEKPEFEFLRERSFKVKIIKLKKQISQGLIMPLSILPSNIKPLQDLDVTEALGIIHYQRQAENAEEELLAKKSKSKILKFFMAFAIFRWIYFKLNTVDKGFPQWFSKSDEERIQTCAKIFINNLDKSWYISEKCDGQSCSIFYHKSKKWGMPKWIFGVCSRNIWLKKSNDSNYWQVAKKFDLENKLKKLKKEVVVQGEILNTNVQKNKYGVKEIDFYVFTVIQDGKKLSVIEMEKFCNEMGLKTVPIIYKDFNYFNQNACLSLGTASIKDVVVKDVVQYMVALSTDKSRLADIQREGIVCRLIENPNISFKVINPSFLLKYGDE